MLKCVFLLKVLRVFLPCRHGVNGFSWKGGEEQKKFGNW